MPKLLIVADDLTGALDTGIQFAKRGIGTRILIRADAGFLDAAQAEEVVVVNTASRHMPADEAYRIVFRAVRAAEESGFDCFYKKTDSALRGNVGAELTAMRDALRRPVALAPAYPAMGRTTVGGIQYIDGVPVAETAFGRDPFAPVLSSDVGEILLKSGAKDDAGIEIFNSFVVPGMNFPNRAWSFCSEHERIY